MKFALPAHVLAFLVLIFVVVHGTDNLEAQSAASSPHLIDETQQRHINWTETNIHTARKYLVETTGGGGGFLDANQDERLDLMLIDQGCPKFTPTCIPAGNALYEQNADGTFTNVAARAGVQFTPGIGMGMAVGDYDNDGFPDIFVTAFGRSTLFHNNGNNTFTDVTEKAGLASPGWAVSAVFFDYDGDGLPDLFVGEYLDWTYASSVVCGDVKHGPTFYCGPEIFHPSASRLYHNNGDGTFTDVTAKAGVALPGKALGVIAVDYDHDGCIDLYVANDSMRNYLFHNNCDGTFSELGLQAEVAFGHSGRPLNGMGVDAADVEGDGFPDFAVGNLARQPKVLFHNSGDGTFHDVTAAEGLQALGGLTSTFGLHFIDIDDSGQPDLLLANGDPQDNAEVSLDGVSSTEAAALYRRGPGGKFRDATAETGTALSKLYYARGLAVGDFDNDGYADALLMQNYGPPALLHNLGNHFNHWLGVRLIGHGSSRDAVGARVVVFAGGKQITRDLVGGASFASASDSRLLFGLGANAKVEKVEVHWPAGSVTVELPGSIDRYMTIEEKSRTPRHKVQP